MKMLSRGLSLLRTPPRLRCPLGRKQQTPSSSLPLILSTRRWSGVISAPFSSRTSSSSSSWQTQSPYELLGVSPTASDKEIKLGYFKAAKESHPDLHPNDARARERFQRVANAYELLKDPQRRRRYDSSSSFAGGFGSGWDGGQQQQQQQQQYQQRQQPRYGQQSQNHHQHQNTHQQWWNEPHGPRQASYHDASELFRTVLQDYSIVQEAARGYIEDLREEGLYAADCLRRGDLRGVWDVVRANTGLIVGVVVPLAVLLRFPGLIAASLTLLFRLSFVGLAWASRLGLGRGGLPWAAQWVWRRIVALAGDRVRRRGGGR